MSKAIKWGVLLLLIITVVISGFTLFGRYLVDYSLETLGFAMEATAREFDETNFLERHVYQNVVQGLALEEAAREDTDFESLFLIETASRSMEEPSELIGFQRAQIYLDKAMEKQKEKKNFAGLLKSYAYDLYRRLDRFWRSLKYYFKKRLAGQAEETFQISDQLLLNQAQEKEKAGNLGEAKEMYKKYLDRYRHRPDRGLVGLSLAHIYIKERRWPEAEELLRQIYNDFNGQKEGNVAANLLRKIINLKKRMKEIEEYLKELERMEGTSTGDAIHFKLAVSYLSIHKLGEAEKHFKIVENIPNAKLRQRAKFYLGWIYKLKKEHSRAESVLLNLLSEEQLDEELKLALHAELADLNMRRGNFAQAHDFYEGLERESKKVGTAEEGLIKGWLDVADVEGGMAGAQRGGAQDIDKIMKRFDELDLDDQTRERIRKRIMDTGSVDLRSRAFEKLKQKKTHQAIVLFKRFLLTNPQDAWALSGLGTCYLLIEDYDQAEEYALRGYYSRKDEYTTALLAYVYSLNEKHQRAIKLYRYALKIKPEYVPSKYNLLGEYLKVGQYEDAHELGLELYGKFEHSSNAKMKAKILNSLGVALWGMHRKSEASDAFKRALEVSPEFEPAEENLREIRLGEAPLEGTETFPAG